MSYGHGRTCGRCVNFIKVNWNDKPRSMGRNGLCDKYDYNINSDSTYATQCKGFKKKAWIRKKRGAGDESNRSCSASPGYYLLLKEIYIIHISLHHIYH